MNNNVHAHINILELLPHNLTIALKIMDLQTTVSTPSNYNLITFQYSIAC